MEQLSHRRYGGPSSDRILFVTSNGVGLGHLTRSLAIARRLPQGWQPIMLTLSQAMPLARRQGLYVEYLPSAAVMGGSPKWNMLLRRRLRQILGVYRPRAVVFDGSFPYLGLREVAVTQEAPFVWCRRAMWRRGHGKASLAWSAIFDKIIEPGEVAHAADTGLTVGIRREALVVGPILLCDREDLLSRTAARRALGLEPDRIHALVQLGAGAINDVESVAGRCVRHLSRDSRVHITVAESPIAPRRMRLPEGISRLSRYPAAPYYPAFDLAVSAAGYNSFHELLSAGVPTLFVPNANTSLDDQVARARYAQHIGIACCADDASPSATETALDELLDDNFRGALDVKLQRLDIVNGAHTAAQAVAHIAGWSANGSATSAAIT